MNTNALRNFGRITIVCLVLFVVALPIRTRAQFTGNNQTNIISSVTSNWAGDYYVGSNFVFDALLIQNGGVLSNSGWGFIGYAAGAKSNATIVSGIGSVWRNTSFGLRVGSFGSRNSLEISNGGKVVCASGGLVVGQYAGASNNSVLVTGNGSVCSNSATTTVGGIGVGNSLVISNGGAVFGSACVVGSQPGANNNRVVVTGSNSLWNLANVGQLIIGDAGSGNSLVISNGGAVVDDYCIVGLSGSSTSNSVLVTGPGSVWMNRTKLTVGFTGRENCLIIRNGGKVVVSNLVVNTGNSIMIADNDSTLECYGRVENNGGRILLFNGGTFHGTNIISGGVLNAGTVLISNITRAGNDVLIQIPSANGFTYRLQVTPSLEPPAWADSGPAQPGTGGVLTFTDSGAVTTAPSRVYRVRVQ